MTTLVEELCKPNVVHLVAAFVRICPSLLVNAVTLEEAMLMLSKKFPDSWPDKVETQARYWACRVKNVLRKWRDIAVYPARFNRAMMTADIEQKRTISRLTNSIKPYCVTRSLSDVAPPSTSSRHRTPYDDHADVVYHLEPEIREESLPRAAEMEDLAFLLKDHEIRKQGIGLPLEDNRTSLTPFRRGFAEPPPREGSLLTRPMKKCLET